MLFFALAFALLEVWHIGLLSSHVVLDLVSSLAGGVLIGGLLVWMSGKMQLRRFDYFILISLILFVVGRFSNYVEGLFFTTIFANLSVLHEPWPCTLHCIRSGCRGALCTEVPIVFAELSTYFSQHNVGGSRRLSRPYPLKWDGEARHLASEALAKGEVLSELSRGSSQRMMSAVYGFKALMFVIDERPALLYGEWACSVDLLHSEMPTTVKSPHPTRGPK